MSSNFASDDNGAYCKAKNYSGSVFPAITDDPRAPSNFPQEAPVVTRIGEYYYLIGSGSQNVAPFSSNFYIFRSKDLREFQYVGAAFDPLKGVVLRGGSPSVSGGYELAPSRYYYQLQTPSLAVDPMFPDLVFLNFSGRVVDRLSADIDALGYNHSAYVAFMSRAELEQKASGMPRFFAGKPDGSTGPFWHTYRVNNALAGAWRTDGGYAQSQVSGSAAWAIPTTGAAMLEGSSLGQAEKNGYALYDGAGNGLVSTWGFRGVSHAAWVNSGVRTFRDPQTQEEWMIYNWYSGSAPHSTNPWRGLHIAAYRRLNFYESDALRFADMRALAYRSNSLRQTEGKNSGCYEFGNFSGYAAMNCATYGASVLYREGKYYLFYTRRNAGTFYRVATSFRGLSVGWDQGAVQEYPLFVKSDAGTPFEATAQVFEGPAGQWYVSRLDFPPHLSTGQVIFKELRFNLDGTIQPLIEATSGSGAPLDLSHYLTPRVLQAPL